MFFIYLKFYSLILLSASSQVYGTDYNQKYIKWNAANIENVEFQVNKLSPTLTYADESFQVVYGISIFTHLSAENHFAWKSELMRVLKVGGILFLTLHGEVFKSKLSYGEKEKFDSGRLVVKSSKIEGHRTYSAYQPVAFVHKLFNDHDIVHHKIGKGSGKLEQDIWIVRKVG